MSTSQKNSAHESLRRSLTTDIDARIVDTGAIPASVLVIIHGADPHVIMTVKPRDMKHHAGEVAFPGGRYEDGDADLLDTALRETREEIGISVGRSDVIGQLGRVCTQSSGYEITPFVHVTESRLSYAPISEVDEILDIPLSVLLAHSETDPPEFPYGTRVIWGASAMILADMRHRIGQA